MHGAVIELLAESDTELTVAAVAARSGVHPTSVYRRWGTVEALLLDVAVDRLSAASPMPDTGTLRGDLLNYARRAAHDLEQPDGLAFLRAVINASGTRASAARRSGTDPAVTFLAERGAQIEAMLDRAAGRGEPRLNYTEVLDGVLAPLYLRALFRFAGINDRYLTELVDRVLTEAQTSDSR